MSESLVLVSAQVEYLSFITWQSGLKYLLEYANIKALNLRKKKAMNCKVQIEKQNQKWNYPVIDIRKG